MKSLWTKHLGFWMLEICPDLVESSSEKGWKQGREGAVGVPGSVYRAGQFSAPVFFIKAHSQAEKPALDTACRHFPQGD